MKVDSREEEDGTVKQASLLGVQNNFAVGAREVKERAYNHTGNHWSS